MTARVPKSARHEMLVIRAKVAVAAQLRPGVEQVSDLSATQIEELYQVLMDAAIDVAFIKATRPAPRKGRLTLAAEDGELTGDGEAIVEKRAAERERRRARRAERAAS